MYKYATAILLLLATATNCCAQQWRQQDFVQYTVKDGLGNNDITCLQQDEFGYIWAGSDEGVNRFDGHTFTVFSPSSQSLQLLSGKVTKIKQVGPHLLGIVNHGGFQVLNTQNFSVRNFTVADSTALTIYRNNVWDAYRIANGYLVSTAYGICFFDSAGKVKMEYTAFKPSDINKRRVLYGRDIFKVSDTEYLVYAEENKIGVYNAALNTYNELSGPYGGWQPFYIPRSTNGTLLGTKYQLNSQQFLFINFLTDSIAFYDHSVEKTVYSKLPFHCLGHFNWNSKITMLDDTHFAINCSNAGFYIFELNKQLWQVTCNGIKQMPSCEINCIFVDKEKRLWLGTHSGLLRQKLKTPFISSYSFADEASQSGYPEVFSCAYRYKNKLYLGHLSRNWGLAIVDTATMQIEKQIQFFGENNMWNEAVSIQMYHADTLWLGTNGGIIWFDTKTQHYGDVLKEAKGIPADIAEKTAYKLGNGLTVNLAPVKNGEAWMVFALQGVVAKYTIANRHFTFYTANTTPALPFNRVKQIVYDSYGNVWVSGLGLARWNNQTNTFDTVITTYGGARKFNSNIVAVTSDSNGSLWLHNEDNGLLQYKINERTFIPYNAGNGLPYNVFECISPVVNNTLWVAGTTVLAGFNTNTKTATLYDYSDGLPDYKPTSRNIYYDTTANCFYLLCGNTVAKYPLASPVVNYSSSDILIQQLSINNNSIINQPTDSLQLNPDSNNVMLTFAIVDFEESGGYTFSYKLHNAETWASLGQQRSLSLNGLRPGKYVVQLKGSSKSGMQKTKTFVFFILPHFWQTTWFMLLVAATVFAATYMLYRNRIRHIEQKANIDRQLAQMEMKALHAQMNPHFIFNSLNSIKEMVLNNENNEASNYLSKFARMIRITLEQSAHTFVTLRSTVDYLNRYVEMEKIRNNNFNCTITVDDTLDQDEIVLPPMLIQPFIENAIWHGIEPNIKTILIEVAFKQHNNQLICVVEDNGVGINKSVADKQGKVLQGKSYGIANIKERIALLNEKYNLQSKVGIIDKGTIQAQTTGTVVTIELPLQMLNE